ncbi:hypothetical protein [Rhizobium sp. C4]|uniref:hypothetical protein n=1 Tax=Rhizobium sp. C4 TaxID=1349800 RepID=UPI001E3E59F8|nr:hypothetical protein [Rhizobium sp. C4]MCD2175358.1 hypothetical protein [Rhizobium sp. C4]
MNLILKTLTIPAAITSWFVLYLLSAKLSHLIGLIAGGSWFLFAIFLILRAMRKLGMQQRASAK